MCCSDEFLSLQPSGTENRKKEFKMGKPLNLTTQDCRYCGCIMCEENLCSSKNFLKSLTQICCIKQTLQ
jgi:hypothetical protein